jgi:serine/threonine-protein kinase RsbW
MGMTEWITIAADIDNLEMIQKFVRSQAEQCHLGQESTYDLMLAVEEAVTNVIRHGYDGSQDGLIHIGAIVDDDCLAIVIRDDARLFDPTTISGFDPSTPFSERRLGGMGIYMMKKSVDEVTHRPLPGGGNELTLVKFHPISKETL